MKTSIGRRGLRLLAVAALVGAGACERNPTGGGHADVAAVRLTIGAGAGTVVTVNAAGQQTPAPAAVQLTQGTHAVVVTWLDASGNAVTNLGSGMALAVAPGAGDAGVGVTFTPNGLFAGTLQLAAPGQNKSMVVRLMHGTHADFAQNLAFTVQ